MLRLTTRILITLLAVIVATLGLCFVAPISSTSDSPAAASHACLESVDNLPMIGLVNEHLVKILASSLVFALLLMLRNWLPMIRRAFSAYSGRWKVQQRVFFDSGFRQFRWFRIFSAAIVDPQIYR